MLSCTVSCVVTLKNSVVPTRMSEIQMMQILLLTSKHLLSSFHVMNSEVPTALQITISYMCYIETAVFA